LRFADAVDRAVGQIGRSPRSGNLRFSYELEIPGLRVRPVTRFPYLVFYVVGDEVVDVWRILHTLISTQPAATSSVSGAAGR
jgi:toxin ParE1/3/4